MELNLEDRGVVTIFGGHACTGKTSVMLKMFFDSYSTNNGKTVIFTNSVKHTTRKVNKVFNDSVNNSNIIIKHIDYNYGLDDIFSFLKKHNNTIVNIIIDDMFLKAKDLLELSDKTNCKVISTAQLIKSMISGESTVSLSQNVDVLINKELLEVYLISKKGNFINLKYNNIKEESFEFDLETLSIIKNK